MKGTFVRYHNVLRPADEDGDEALRAMKEGQEVVVDVSPSRNPKFHRLFFKLLKLFVDNSDMFSSIDDALVAVKVACGEVETWIDPNTGQVYYIPRSIAFEKMDGARFRRLFDRAVFVICERWMTGMNADDLRREAYRLVDGEERSSLGERAA